MFKIATEADLIVSTSYNTQIPEVVAVGGPRNQAFLILAQILDADVKIFANRKIIYSELNHRFVFLVHQKEMGFAEQAIVSAVRPFVWLAPIELGIPTTYQYSIYVSDIAALGLSPNFSKDDVMSSQIRFATKVAYIKEK